MSEPRALNLYGWGARGLWMVVVSRALLYRLGLHAPKEMWGRREVSLLFALRLNGLRPCALKREGG